MKDLGTFSGLIEMDTSKLKDQLNAISMAAGALAHNLAEIDATHAAGEKGSYTKAMVDPEEPKEKYVGHGWVKHNDLVMICKAGDGRGESPEYIGLYGRVTKVYSEAVRVCIREDNEYHPSKEVNFHKNQIKVVVSS